MQACIEAITAQLSAAMDPTDEIRQLAAIRVDQPLASRLIDVLGVVDAYYRRLRADMGAFEQAVITGAGAGTGTGTGTGTDGAPSTRSSGGADIRFISSLPELRQAVVRLREPNGECLRLPADALAEAFLTMSGVAFRTGNADRSPLPGEQVVDLFLHGALITR
jgi:hypothetical protein